MLPRVFMGAAGGEKEEGKLISLHGDDVCLREW